MTRYRSRDKVALFTGGTEGTACADAFCSLEAHVVGSGLLSEAAARSNGVPVIYGDVTRPETRGRLENNYSIPERFPDLLIPTFFDPKWESERSTLVEALISAHPRWARGSDGEK